MKTAAKIAAAVVAFFVFAFVAAAIILPLVINTNDFKPQIEHLVYERTGRHLKIPGKLHLSVFPWLGIDIGRASLSNPPGFDSQPFASIKQAKIRLKLLPLLHEQIHIGTVSLEGLHLNLITNARGQHNWTVISKAHGQTHAQPVPQPKGTGGGSFSLNSLQVASLELNDAALTWRNVPKGTHYKVSNLHLRTGGLRSGSSFPVDLGFQLSSDKPAMTADVHLTGQASMDMAGNQYRIRNLSVNADTSGKGVPGGSQKITLSGDASADLKSQTASISNLQLSMAGVHVNGNVHVHPVTRDTAFTGSINVAQFNPRTVMSQLDMKAPNTSDDKALTRFSLTSDFSGTPQRISLHDLKVKLDDSNLTGRASVDGFSHPAVRFDLSLDQMDVDRYLPPHSKSGKGAGKSGKKRSTSGKGGINSVRVPVDAIKPLNVDGVLKADSLKLMNLHFSNARLAVKAKDGRLSIQPLAAKLYHGTMKLTSEVNASGKKPTYAVSAHLGNVHFSPLLQDLLGRQFLAGTGSLTLELTSAGQTVGDMRRALNGRLSLHMANGAVYGFNLSELIARARARLQGKSMPSSKQARTEFNAFSFLATISNGTLKSRDLTAHSRWLDVSGAGNANLVNNQLNYIAQVELTQVPPDLKKQGIASLKGVKIPVHFKGGLTSPSIHVDLAAALRGVAQQRLQQERQRLQKQGQKSLQQQEKRLEDKARKKLQQFLGQ